METNSFTKEWNNGHFKEHTDVKFNFYDTSTDELVGTIPGLAINIQGKDFVGPISIQINIGGEGICTDGSPLTEILEESHCGLTLQRSGNIIAHSVLCDL